MKMLKHIAALLLALGMLVPAGAEEVDWSFADMSGETVETYQVAAWNFPIELEHMEAELIMLVNKSMFISADFVPDDLVTMKALKLDKQGNNTNGGVRRTNSGMQLQRECAEALVRLCDTARAEGHQLYLKSAYRSYKTQDNMYYNRLKKNGYDDGWVTKPGASDHQTGLGCDVVPKNWTDRGMNEKMAKEPEIQWMAENCARFGFILRYPEDKEDVTEINYEPWHLRYVGVEVATYIMDNGLCLEEFHDQLRKAIDEYISTGGNPDKVKNFIQTSAKDKYAKK